MSAAERLQAHPHRPRCAESSRQRRRRRARDADDGPRPARARRARDASPTRRPSRSRRAPPPCSTVPRSSRRSTPRSPAVWPPWGFRRGRANSRGACSPCARPPPKPSRTRRTAMSRSCSAPRCRGSPTPSSRVAASSRRFPRTPTMRRSTSRPRCRSSRTSCGWPRPAAKSGARRGFEPATVDEIEALYAHGTATLAAMRFLDPRMPKRLLPRLRRLFSRAALEKEEVNILRGILARIDQLLAQALIDGAHLTAARTAACAAPDAFCPACGQNTRERLPTFRAVHARSDRPVHRLRRQVLENARGAPVPAWISHARISRRASPALHRPGATLPRVEPRALRDPSSRDGIDQDRRTVAFDPPKEPKTRVESGELLTLDDDFNVNLSELAGTPGILRKPIARFNSLSARAKARADRRRDAALRPVRDVRAPARLRGAAESRSISGVSGVIPARPRLYGEHLVFAAHNHAFLFVVGSLMAVSPSGYLTGVLVLWVLVYLAWSTRAVYGGRWLGIAARALVLGVAYVFLFALVTIGLVIAAVAAALNMPRRQGFTSTCGRATATGSGRRRAA